MNRKTIYFSGHVQGVGFRYTAQNIAENFDVSGYVRNLPDGRVELVMEGADEEIGHMLEQIQEQMGSFIRNSTSEQSPATGEFSEFSVQH